MMVKIYFQTVTEESAQHGDFAEQGEHNEIAVDSTNEAAEEIVNALGGIEPSCSQYHDGIWYSSADPETDMHTGEETYYSAHLYGFTKEQELDVYRLITKKGGLI